MKWGRFLGGIFWSILVGVFIGGGEAQAEIASEDAFEGAVWEKIIEDTIETPIGVIQSICATEEYIITLENVSDIASDPDIVKAYYRNDTDAEGNPVEQYTLAKRVAVTDYEHANGMAYNPNTGEIAVALYTARNPENRGCIFLMDAETLEYKGKVQIAADYNILGIGYDEENDRYVIQTNAEGGYSFKILDNQFQVIEDLGNYADTAKGDNFQDLCVSGDYIINFPLTLNLGIGDYIHMYSISQKRMVSDAQLDFRFENVTADEPESICELEPGMFAAAVNVTYADGRRNICVYQTMVPYNFPVDASSDETDEAESDAAGEVKEQTAGESAGQTVKTVMKVILVILGVLALALLVYTRYVMIRRERIRKLERARRERERIRKQYEEI